MGFTNRGKFRLAQMFFRNTGVPTNLYLALVTSAAAPSAATNTFSQLTQIAAGNGYVDGGFQLSRNTTDFDVATEDDTNDRALVQVKDVVWTASGGPIPASGNGARYVVLLDDNVTIGSRDVLAWEDLSSDRSVSDGQPLRLLNTEFRLGVPVGMTNRGMFRILDAFFRAQNIPTNIFAALFTATTAPTADTNTVSQLEQIAVGNGYADGGISLGRNATDFDVLNEDDGNNRVQVQLRDLVWTASGGPLPASGLGASYVGLTDDNVTVGSRDVLMATSLGGAYTVSDTNTITLTDTEIRGA